MHRRRGSPPRPIYGWRNRIASAVKTRARHSGELLRRRERRPGLAAELPAGRARVPLRYKGMELPAEHALLDADDDGDGGDARVRRRGGLRRHHRRLGLRRHGRDSLPRQPSLEAQRARHIRQPHGAGPRGREGGAYEPPLRGARRALAGRAEQGRAHLFERRALRRGRRRPRRPRVSGQRVPVSAARHDRQDAQRRAEIPTGFEASRLPCRKAEGNSLRRNNVGLARRRRRNALVAAPRA